MLGIRNWNGLVSFWASVIRAQRLQQLELPILGE